MCTEELPLLLTAAILHIRKGKADTLIDELIAGNTNFIRLCVKFLQRFHRYPHGYDLFFILTRDKLRHDTTAFLLLIVFFSDMIRYIQN